MEAENLIENKKSFIYDFLSDNDPRDPSYAKEFIERIEDNYEKIEKYYSFLVAQDSENIRNIKNKKFVRVDIAEALLSYSPGKRNSVLRSMMELGKFALLDRLANFLAVILILIYLYIPINNFIHNRELYNLQDHGWKSVCFLILSILLISYTIYALKMKAKSFAKNATNNYYLGTSKEFNDYID